MLSICARPSRSTRTPRSSFGGGCAREKVSFKRALNDAIRDGCRPASDAATFRTRTARMGTPLINLDRALQVAAELEDEELLLRLRSGA